jgi:hypothetical protein
VVVPVAYSYLDDFGLWVKHHFVSKEREMEITAEREISGLAP